MISWISQTTLLKLPGPADLLYTILGRSGPFSQNMHMQHFLVQALVLSRLDYCNALLTGLPANSIKPLQLIQNAAARLIFNEPKRTHVTPLFINLHWLPIAARIKFKALMFAYRTTTGSAPLYLNSLLQTYVPSRNLRSASERRIIVPSQRGTKSFFNFFINCFHLVEWPAQLNPSSWILTQLQETAKNTSLPSLFDPLTLAVSISNSILSINLSSFYLKKNKKRNNAEIISNHKELIIGPENP